MLYVVLIPGWIWTTLLVGMWAILVYLSYGIIRHSLMKWLLAVLMAQALAASATARATTLDPISKFACLMGIFGGLVSFVVVIVEVVVLLLLFRIWQIEGKRSGLRFGIWVLMWSIFVATALLAHARSVTLCTV